MEQTTKKDFEEFIAGVEDWCETLGNTRYRLDFAHVPLTEARASVTLTSNHAWRYLNSIQT